MKYFVALLLLWTTILAPVVLAAEIRVKSGGSIQDAVDQAVSGDTIIVEPGTYENNSTNATYAVHITKSNIKLVGESTSTNKVLIKYLAESLQRVGVFVAPSDCAYNQSSTVGGCDGTTKITDIEISGVTVEGFPHYGIRTRRVDDFEISECQAINNPGIGISATISTNGLLQSSSASGSNDTGMSCVGCENVVMTNNTLFDCTLELEIIVSNNVVVRNNKIYNNTVGVGMLHPTATTEAVLPTMKNWTVEDNIISDNNKVNGAPPGTRGSALPRGFGILMVGVSDHVVRNNAISGSGTAGLTMIGYCTSQAVTGTNVTCDLVPPPSEPSANNNLVSFNTFNGNGQDQDPLLEELGLPGVDLLYFQSPSLDEVGDGNCFEFILGTTYFAIVDGEPSGLLGQNLPNGCGSGFFRRLLNRILTLPAILFRLLFG